MLFCGIVGCLGSVAACSGDTPSQELQEEPGERRQSQTWAASSIFMTSQDWFPATYRPYVWTGDVTGDGTSDIVGVAINGDIYVATSTETAFGSATLWRAGSIFGRSNGWYELSSYIERVWLTDVTGDGRADIVGVANNGDVWISESNGTTFNASHMVSAATPFGGSNLTTTYSQRLWCTDVTSDGRADIVGVDGSGNIIVMTASGSGTVATFAAPSTWLAGSILNPANGWFDPGYRGHVWFADVSGDGLSDVLAIDFDGQIWIGESTGGTSFSALRIMGQSLFVTDTADDTKNWFSTAQQPRVFVGDVTGDGRADIVGIAPTGAGDGDVWAAIPTASAGADMEYVVANSAYSFRQRPLLRDSIFKTAGNWFTTATQQRVWLADISGDGLADLLGVTLDGHLWVARATTETGRIGQRSLLLPSEQRAATELVTSGNDFSTSYQPRLWLTNATGDGIKDIVYISGAPTTDGRITRTAGLPTTVTSVTQMHRSDVSQGGALAVSVQFSRAVGAANLAPYVLLVEENGQAYTPSTLTVSSDGRTATWTVTVPSQGTNAVDWHVTLPGSYQDRWGVTVDGTGDGLAGGDTERHQWWHDSLVAGVESVDLSTFGLDQLPWAGGWDYCAAHPDGGISLGPTTNAPKARVVVIGGGGTCASAADCRATTPPQACVANQCVNSDGTEANQTIVLANVDAIGINVDRIRELLRIRFGIAKQNVFISATHAHALARTIALFTAPYFDDRNAGGVFSPYVAWVENAIATAVGTAMQNMYEVDASFGSVPVLDPTYGFPIGMNRRHYVATDEFIGAGLVDKNAYVLKLRAKGTTENHVTLVNHAVHPTYTGYRAGEDGGAPGPEMDSDFPGYMATAIETTECPQGAPKCVALFVNGGAGDINPNYSMSGNPDLRQRAQGMGTTLANAAGGAATNFSATDRFQIRVERNIQHYAGTTSCNLCSTMNGTRVATAGYWDVESSAVVIGRPGSPPLVAIATMPGEPYVQLQIDLRNQLAATTPTMLFGYTNGYVGYLPTSLAWKDYKHAQSCTTDTDCRLSGQCNLGLCDQASSDDYSIGLCSVSSAGGPAYFDNSISPTPGESMSSLAVSAITQRLVP